MKLSEEQLAELLGALPPAPEGWVRAAIELVSARAAMDELVSRAIADRRARDAIIRDLEGALRGAGVEPRPQLVEMLRTRLGEIKK